MLYGQASLWLECCVVWTGKSVVRVLCCIDRQVCGKSVALYKQASLWQECCAVKTGKSVVLSGKSVVLYR